MDKVKEILALAKKYLFWIILGVVLLTTVVAWYLGTSEAAEQFKKRKAEISAKEKEVSDVVAKADHPNQDSIKSIVEKQDALKSKVLAAWMKLYEEQRERNPWPSFLGEDFLKEVNKKGPNDEIDIHFRERYQNAIEEIVPLIDALGNIRQTSSTDGGVGAGLGPAQTKTAVPPKPTPQPKTTFPGKTSPKTTPRPESAEPSVLEDKGLVEWDPANKASLVSKLKWTTRPSTKRVRLTQEDIWVYRSLLQVIANANEGVTERRNAAVKKILLLDIGAAATKDWAAAENKVFSGQSVATPADATGAAATTGGAEGGASADADIIASRYVDDKGTPISADAAGTAPEFKMMPICMRLVADQRKIPKLLAECANRAMPIEVKRVRLSPDAGGTVISLSSTPDAGAAAAAGQTPTTKTGDAKEAETLDVTVEILGVIFIYNPPDKEKLGGAKGADSASQAPPADAATPAPAN